MRWDELDMGKGGGVGWGDMEWDMMRRGGVGVHFNFSWALFSFFAETYFNIMGNFFPGS